MLERARAVALFALLLVAACGSREDAAERTRSGPNTPAAPPATTARPKPAPAHSSAPAPAFESDEEIDAFCRQFKGLSLPPGDQPTPAERKALAKCEADKLYYGIGVRSDYGAARKCAYAELARGEDERLFEGPNILMMLYANGRGVPTNFDLALKFACTRQAESTERRNAVAKIWKARAGAGLSQVLDVCDFEVGPQGLGSCAQRDFRIAALKREERKAKATLGLKSRELSFLEKAARDFSKARAENELDKSGSGRAVFQLEEEARLADAYVDLLEKLIDPTFVPNAPAGAETRLAAIYAELRGCKELRTTWAKQAGFSYPRLASTQRLWTKYRDAWIALISKVRPKSQVGAWRAFLAEQRLRMLDTIPLCQD